MDTSGSTSWIDTELFDPRAFEMIDFKTEKHPGGTAVVSVDGQLDDTNRNYFFDCVRDLLDEGVAQIIVDCRGLGFVSSAGLAGLVKARNQAQTKGGKIYLTHVSAAIVNVLNLTKLNKLLAIYPSTSELLAELSPAKDS